MTVGLLTAPAVVQAAELPPQARLPNPQPPLTPEQAPLPYPPPPTASYPPQELDRIVSPVALYPDPLLAQVLAATTLIERSEQEREGARNGRAREEEHRGIDEHRR
jgi:hypothetical protein